MSGAYCLECGNFVNIARPHSVSGDGLKHWKCPEEEFDPEDEVEVQVDEEFDRRLQEGEE